MPVIKVNDQQYSLRPGPNRLGSGADADVQVDGAPGAVGAAGVHAIVEVGDDTQAVIRRTGDGAAVRVNGIALVDPTPLMHGDRVEISGTELLYSDDSKAGATQYVSAGDVAALVQKRAGAGRATLATGGRLVSLVDGKEYSIGDAVVIGRDAASDVVVPQTEVSRKHAEITPVEGGYQIRDTSANGVFVNGNRVEGTKVLSRSDVIRIGTEEFRFYADARPSAATPARPAESVAAAPSAPPPMAPEAPSVAAPAAPPVTPVAPTAPAAAPAAPAPPAPPMAPAAAAVEPTLPVHTPAPDDLHVSTGSVSATPETRPVLATLTITNEGPTKGTQLLVCVPLAHVGRGAHNDISVTDESVSDTHAKLQRRDDGWYVVDLNSTNGTYVGGQRVVGERRLEGAPDVRFGGVKAVFRAQDVVADGSKGTRAIVGVDVSKLRQTAPATLAAAASSPAEPPRPQPGIPPWVWGIVVLAVAGAAAFFLLNR